MNTPHHLKCWQPKPIDGDDPISPWDPPVKRVPSEVTGCSDKERSYLTCANSFRDNLETETAFQGQSGRCAQRYFRVFENVKRKDDEQCPEGYKQIECVEKLRCYGDAEGYAKRHEQIKKDCLKNKYAAGGKYGK